MKENNLSENKLKIILKKNFYLPPGLKNPKKKFWTPLYISLFKKFLVYEKFGGEF